MAYNGMIQKSRTYDALAVFSVLSALQPLAMDLLQQFALSPKWVSLSNFVMIGILAYLRFKTTGPVGQK
jgi:hypothetical protein